MATIGSDIRNGECVDRGQLEPRPDARRLVAATVRRRLRLPALARGSRRVRGRVRSRAQRSDPAAARRARGVGPPTGNGPNMGGPTLLAHGTDEQQRRFARAGGERPARSGASCSASPAPAPTSPASPPRAERDGDEFVITGQKVWNSSADVSEWGMLRRPHQPRRAEASRHHVHDDRHAPARRRGSPAGADERRRRVLRGVHDRGAGAGRRRHRRRRQRLERRPDHPRQRTNDGCGRQAVRKGLVTVEGRRRCRATSTVRSASSSRRLGGPTRDPNKRFEVLLGAKTMIAPRPRVRRRRRPRRARSGRATTTSTARSTG